MRVVVQRVKEASVAVSGEIVGRIGPGLLVFLGVKKNDTLEMTQWFVNKLTDLRIFADGQGKMNLSVRDVGGAVLVVSQFTLYGNCINGRRPDFIQAAAPAFAEQCYEQFVAQVRQAMGAVQTGRFGAKMEVVLVNDGPVTLVIER